MNNCLLKGIENVKESEPEISYLKLVAMLFDDVHDLERNLELVFVYFTDAMILSIFEHFLYGFGS